MTEDVLLQIFDPFFTTKAVGHGNGLGLSTVHGIIMQSNGHIEVSSKLGEGTLFWIYLPCVKQPIPHQSESVELVEVTTGSETILLVEDDDNVRKIASQILTSAGYSVIEVQNPEHASIECEAYEKPIDLLLADVIMPKIDGVLLSKQLTATYPNLKVVLMSGYTDDTLNNYNVFETGTPFLQKPFSPTSLLHKVRQVLDND